MTQNNMRILSRLLLIIIIAGLFFGTASADGLSSYRWCPGPDSRTGVCYDWDWVRDDGVLALEYYYHIIHVLTGWGIPLIEFVEAVDPEALATMPPEMYNHFKGTQSNETQSSMSSGALSRTETNGRETWRREGLSHIWVSPEGYIYSGDLPPYQYLVWKGWEEYADNLPPAPPGAPFPPPPYPGTPKNTLPLARTNPVVTATPVTYYPIENPCPDAISVSPRDGSWDWTPEVKEALSRLGLDPYMGNTRLGYEKAGNTITMVGMTPSAVMREWTLVRVNGEWTCSTADESELADLLFILEKIGAVPKPGTGSIQQFIAQERKDRFAERMQMSSRSGASASSIRESTFASRLGTTTSPAIPAVSGSSGSAFTTDPAHSAGTARDAWAHTIAERTAQTTAGDSAQAFRSDLASARAEFFQDYASRLGGTG